MTKTFVLLAAFASWSIAPSAFAQLDLLRPIKVTRPTVIIALDLSSRMQRDPLDVYLDPRVYSRAREGFEASIGVDDLSTAVSYRRRYVGLEWQSPGADLRATCTRVEAVGDLAPAFAELDQRTRLGRARAALARAIDGNNVSVRFGLVTSRQSLTPFDPEAAPAIVTAVPAAGLTDTGAPGRWRTGIPSVVGPGSEAPPGPPRVAADGPAGNEELRRLLDLSPAASGGLVAAGWDGPAAVDAPLAALLQDVRAEAGRLIAADDTCGNTVVVLLAAGADPSVGSEVLGEDAASLLLVAGRRVPVYVVALSPPPEDAVRLRAIARRSGGQYVEIAADVLQRVPGSEPVPEMVAAINVAVQHAFAAFPDFNAPPSAEQPYGPPSYVPTVGPIVGTVNLANAMDAAGNSLPLSRILAPSGEVLPQPSNVLVTGGFELPGFFGRLSAFRVYRPVPDTHTATGYRFSSDGTRLWTARTPEAASRNLYTVIPGVGVVPFRSSSAAALAPYLGVRDPGPLIEAIRALPLGPSLNSTPALLEPPSARYADLAYVAFADTHRNRPGIVFVGANDGMMHALDARTGVEVWAVVPFNLLPKLRHLREGQPIDGFAYFAEGSPRLADVRVAGTWRTYLLFGEGPGGCFYQAFDVTLDGIEAAVPPDAQALPALLTWFAQLSSVPFVWSYPRYEMFDASMAPAGDLRPASSEAERSVGETWSTPAVGRAGAPPGAFVAIVGSGPLGSTREQLPNRNGVHAGTRIYMLDMATGALLDSRDVGSDGVAEDQDGCPAGGCGRLKNALQADPIAQQDDQATIVSVYAGDLDGRLWRFPLSQAPAPGFSGGPTLLFSGGADQPIFGSIARLAGSRGESYLFFGTGSDLLPRSQGMAAPRLVGLSESSGGITPRFQRLLATSAESGVDEGMAGAPVVAGSVVYFATTSRAAGGCSLGECSLYALTASGGVAYDTNDDRRREATDAPVVSRVRLGRTSAPVVADRHLFVATGDRVQVYGDPEGFALGQGPAGLRILSWREVRQP